MSPPSDSTASTRSLTHSTKRFVRDTAGSQSLERGLHLLRAFRAGVTSLTNSDLAMRTGLPRPTVSRLTRSLVDAGFLIYDMERQAYRLSAICVSLADAYRRAAPEVEVAVPFMRKVAERSHVNVGLATADELEMVYLAAYRDSPDIVSRTRRVVPGTRISIVRSAVGRAYVTGLEPGPRDALMEKMAKASGKRWPAMRTQFNQARSQISRYGYCKSMWEAGVLIGIGTPLIGPSNVRYALNISAPADDDNDAAVRRYGEMLLHLAAEICRAWNVAAENDR
jgi:IclR family transcriptional regulator, positive regulator for flagellar biogenesis